MTKSHNNYSLVTPHALCDKTLIDSLTQGVNSIGGTNINPTGLVSVSIPPKRTIHF